MVFGIGAADEGRGFRGVLAVSVCASLGLELRVGFAGIWAVRELGISTGRLALVYAVQALIEAVASVAAGWLADRLSRRPLAVASACGSTVVALGLAGSAGHPLAGQLLLAGMGAVDALLWVACSVTLADIVQDDQLERAYAAQRTANAAAYAAGPLLAGAMLVFGFAWLFCAAAAASGITAALAWRCLPGGVADVASPHEPRRSARSLIADRHVVALFVAGTLAYLAFFGTETVLPVALVAADAVSPAVFGLLFAINPLITAFVQLPLTARLATVSVRQQLVGGTLLMGCAPLLLLVRSDVPSVAVVLALFTLGELVWAPSVSAFAARTAPPSARGAYLGALAATYSIGFALAPAAGFSARSAGGDAALWMCLATSAALAALIYLALTREAAATRCGFAPTNAGLIEL